MNISTDKKRLIIAEIRKCRTFTKAPTSSSMLQYLFEETLKGTDLKEKLIEIDFFGKSKSTDKGNPRVRVNIYNLRKKLTSYYEKEGKNDSWQVVIDKGQYQVKFVAKNPKKRLIKMGKPSILIPYLLLFIVLLLLVLQNLPKKAPMLWNSFLSEKSTTTLFIGDVFGIMGTTATGNRGWNRDYSINKLEDFYAFCDHNPEMATNIEPSNYTYTNGMAAFSTQRLTLLFKEYEKEFPIRFSMQSTIEDITDGNSIYIGPIKNNNKFVYFFNKENPYFKIAEDDLLFSNHPTIKDTVFHLNSDGTESDYAIVSKVSGPNNSEQFIFFSNHDIGVRSTVEFFTNTDSIKHFTNQYLKTKTHFTALFLTKGVSRTNTDLDLIWAVAH
ncbi:hypothetical protein BZG02_05330 [Labilibaculum filiforme]|uniref:OmpR/PhoB-type domain-containing protein n=1 Tax=Labilibaculum filiforme TaxID=1940526 RepID=A0A2N3I1Q9_9BACT|nr:hypothetical protein [Labilibaculum filiforme]PKQ64245.1 hypothetical protein BZG02_05330 [Labilibaculum filiforme]